MLPPTLWVEIIIAGFVYLIAGIFFILNSAQIYNFQFMGVLRDYVALITLIAVFVSYILGMLMHRIIQMIILRPLNAFLQKIRVNFNIVGDAKPNYYSMSFILYQYGSQYLQREIDIQYSAFALFTSLVVSIPILGVSLSRWLSNTSASRWSPYILLISLVFSVLFFIAAARQRKHFNGIRDEAFTELMKFHKRNLGSKKMG
jgi:hypothetical protein